MAQLSGAQVTQLQTALLDAFDQDDLNLMVKVEMGEDLASIAGSGKLSAVVFNLIHWAEQHERVYDLVQGAQTQRPRNSTFAALAGELAGTAHEPTAKQGTGKPLSTGAISIGKIEAVNVGETQIIDQRDATFNISDKTKIDTGGGAYIGGSVNTGGGKFVGRDQTVQGDEITAGDISGTGVAIGSAASVQQGLGGAELAMALAPLIDAIQRAAPNPETQAAAMHEIEQLKQELAKGKNANDGRVAGILDDLAKLVPGAVAAVVSAFGTPLLGGIAGPITQFVLNQLKRGG